MIRFHSRNMLGLAFLAVAQSFAAAAIPLGLGAVGGVNIGNADIEGHSETDPRIGMAMGLRLEFGVSSPFSLLVEPTYVQKGADFSYDAGLLGEADASGELDYVEIPLLLKAKFGAMKTHLFLFAGPSIGINVAAKGNIESLSDTFEEEVAPVVYSGDVGVGIAFQVQQYVYLSAEGRYSHAFSDALDESVGDIDSWKSRDFRLMAGVMVELFD